MQVEREAVYQGLGKWKHTGVVYLVFFCTYRLNVEYLGISQTLAHIFFLSGSVNSHNFTAKRVPPNSASLILLLSVSRKRFHLQRLTEFLCNVFVTMHVLN